MSEWYDRVVPSLDLWMINFLGEVKLPSKPKPRDVEFRRMPKRNHRSRYYVLMADDRGAFKLANAVIQYQKSRNAWAVIVVDDPITEWSITTLNGSHVEPVKRFRTLMAAKMALNPNPLDRVGAEIDAICEATNDSATSLSAGDSAPQT